MKKEWIIRHEDNHYNGSLELNTCHNIVEYIMDPKTGEQHLLIYFSEDRKPELVVSHKSLILNETIYHLIGHFNDNMIVAIGSKREKELTRFTQINGRDIRAAFLYGDYYWYLFGGRYYCKLRLTAYGEPCKPLLISDWIETCTLGWVDPMASGNRPKDISLYVFIVMAVITVAIVILVIIVLLIAKEWKKRGTYMTQPSVSYSS